MKIRFSREARATPDSIAGLKVPYAAAKRTAPQWRWYLILTVVASPAILLILGLLGGFLTRSAQGSVALDQMEVRAVASGAVAEVHIEPGLIVKQGDALVTTRQPEVAVAELSTQTTRSASHGRELSGTHGPGATELALKARGLRLAQERRDSIASLLADGAATRAELREAEIALNQAAEVFVAAQRANVNQGRAINVIDTNSQAKRDTAATSNVNSAPFEGQVLDVFVSSGEIVRAGDPLVLLGRNLDPKVIAYVPPTFATRLSPGTPATILFADGTRSPATVAEPARVTRRMPADLVDNFGMRPMMVVLKLSTEGAWPESQTIHGMPVAIRFHYAWERSVFGSWMSPMLNLFVSSP
jgi:multidrug resistance efflux pump